VIWNGVYFFFFFFGAAVTLAGWLAASRLSFDVPLFGLPPTADLLLSVRVPASRIDTAADSVAG
jgi:hypothetical protein